MLPRLKPRCYYDLVIAVSIVRPGPIQGDMVHPYLRRRDGLEPVDYPNDAVKDVLKRTLGVTLFQEQCMQLAVVAAGFTPGEADQLRRAMATWRKEGVIEGFRRKMLDGMRANGIDGEFAERIFNQIRGFGEYGFPESHAASFALLVYVSCWLKRRHPAHFTCGLLNSQPMGFYAPAQLVRNLREHGREVLPVDVNASRWDCTVEDDALRLGLRMVHGLHEAIGRSIERARSDRPFASRDDFRRRTQAPRSQLTKLAEADAFQSLGENRRQALWNALAETGKTDGAALFDLAATDDEEAVSLPAMMPEQAVREDYRSTSLSLRAHPLAFQRERLDTIGVLPCGELANVPHGRQVTIAGLVLVKQRPGTAKGITFVTIEDETSIANLILHATTWEANRKVARSSAAWIVKGHVEKRGKVIHVIAARLEDADAKLRDLRVRSRDFQ
jgi:error-prone DNA polymerase